jgi:hypothetical protein
MSNLKRAFALASAVSFTLCIAHADEGSRPNGPRIEPLVLQPVAKLPPGPDKEISGIVHSRLWPDVFWTLNDSGDKPRVYAIRRDGSMPAEKERNNDKEPGTAIGGAINVDWEDITVDDAGHLIVADLGNNENDRRDLTLYFLAEPSPSAERTAYLERVFVRYPDQRRFPAPDDDFNFFNFDCEAVFSLGSKIGLVTKHRSDELARLYFFDPSTPRKEGVVPVELVGEFNVEGQATAADATADGRRIVVATYSSFWLFDVDDADHPLAGPVSRINYSGPEQIESVCFADDDKLLAADEKTGQLYEVPLSAFPPAATIAERSSSHRTARRSAGRDMTATATAKTNSNDRLRGQN